MAIEVEKKAVFTKRAFGACAHQLIKLGAQDLGQNDTRTIFYLTDDAQIKVQHAVSKQSAKIAWKSGGMDGSHQREEVELPISPNDLAIAQRLIERLVPEAKKYDTSQTRHDYILDGVIVSLKYSDSWGYHAELDVTVDNDADAQDTLVKIEQVAARLGITLLSNAEEKAIVERHLAKT